MLVVPMQRVTAIAASVAVPPSLSTGGRNNNGSGHTGGCQQTRSAEVRERRAKALESHTDETSDAITLDKRERTVDSDLTAYAHFTRDGSVVPTFEVARIAESWLLRGQFAKVWGVVSLVFDEVFGVEEGEGSSSDQEDCEDS